MRRLMEFVIMAACLALLTSPVRAQATDRQSDKRHPAKENQPSKAANKQPTIPRNERGEPELGAVQQAGSLIGQKVRSADDQALGIVDDLLLDLDDGRVALILLKAEANTGQTGLALPPAVVSVDQTKRTLTAKVTAEQARMAPAWKSAEALDHAGAQLAAIYRHFNQAPYQREKAKPDAAPDIGSGVGFVTLASVRGVAVKNARGDELGTVSDMAVSVDKGLIGYVAVACSCFDDAAGKLFPIPLTAFVVKPGEKAWILELPLDVLANTPTFSEQQWPEKIDRGWVEYVHVRYGRSPFGGAESQLRVERR